MRSAPLKLGILTCVLAGFLIAPAGASALQKLDDVACTSSTFCFAVGASDAGGSTQAQARKWDGTKWSDVPVPAPDGATQSKLASVTCWTTVLCAAVGDYADEEKETTLALAMGWDGSSWDTEDLPTPAGALSTKLTDFACPSTCLAVGSYVDSAEVRRSMAMVMSGTEWSLRSVPIPSGATLSELEGVSCTAVNDCVAVGSFVNSAGVTKTLALTWNGTSFSIASTPEPAGAELNQLYDVSCRPTAACTAVGTYFTASGEQKTLALRRDAAKSWTIQSTPNQAGALSNRLTGVSCSTTTSCVATGVVELGSKDLPFVLGWNGTSWTQQSIDAEALGASSIKLSSLACLSATDCKAVGAVAYGRSAADRNLAFSWNGSAWLVSEAGEYTREWLRLDASQATRWLNGISCSAPLACFAVGGAVGDDGTLRSQIAFWKGEDWRVEPAAAPAGATASELTAIDCIWTTFCLAVGRYTDSEGVDRPVAQHWNGTSWSVQPGPSPSGAKAVELSGVKCAYADCTAVGSYVDTAGNRLPLAMIWDDGAWSLASVPVPKDAVEGRLHGVSCITVAHCVAVGASADAFGHEEAFTVKRLNSDWTELATPAAPGDPAHVLRAVDCETTSVCVAVGGIEGATGGDYAFAARWDGSKWTELDPPTANGARYASSLASISCVSLADCKVVGDRPSGSTRPPVVLRYDGENWAEGSPAEYASGASSISLRGISCYEGPYGPTRCNTVGSASYGGFPAKNFGLSYEAGAWITPYFPVPGGGLRGVSCPQAESCMAVGDSIEPGGDPARAWDLWESGWESKSTAAASDAFLTDVSCTSKDQCTAVGRQDVWPFKPLAERWNGTAWSTQSVPVPSGRSSNPEAISCPTASFCVAVGFTWPATGPGAQKVLVQSWNGSSWSTASPTLPGTAVASFLYDVTCTSASVCKAAGSYTDAAGVSHGLVLSWNGTSWSSASISPPSGYSGYLRGIDCTSSVACTAVGSYTHASTNARGSAAFRWNGSTWTEQALPTPEGATSTALLSVDCYSSTRCVAVGSAADPATQNPYVVGWGNGSWSLEPAPAIAGNGSSTLESVSCFSAADCTAVGIAQFADGPRELLVVQTEGEDPESEDPVAVAGESVPKFSAEQKEAVADILAEDASLQAAIGTAEYDPQIGVWTEIDEETGDIALVGAYVEAVLEEPETWPERTWPAAQYEFGDDGYEAGTYEEAEVEASASLIESMSIRLALDFDAEEFPLDGEVAEIAPELNGAGSVTLDPESYLEYDPAVRGY